MQTMSTAIAIENLSKRYLVNHERKRGYRTLRETLVKLAAVPLQRLRGKRRSTTEEFWALKDVSLNIPAGEVVGIIGRNGAGKSTLLKILSRITKPTKGRVKMNGRVGSLLEVGTGFHPELTGRENIYLNGSILGMRKREIDGKFDEIVDFAEIEQFLDTPVKRYSSGMYVRLAFAVAAHLEPEIMIVDEVLAVGDAGFQKKCLGKIEDVAASGRTVFFVSHNMSAVLQLCTHAVLLDAGQVAALGDPAEVTQKYFGQVAPNSERVMDLAGVARHGNEPCNARLLRGELLDSPDSNPWSIEFGQTLSARIDFELLRPTQGVDIGLALCTACGGEVASSRTSDDGFECDSQRGVRSVRVTYPGLHLLPGRYHFCLGLHSTRGLEDYVGEVMHFDVMPNERSASLDAHRRHGALIPQIRAEELESLSAAVSPR
jgi:lipopolysaccharide transport system ATP-binding protein